MQCQLISNLTTSILLKNTRTKLFDSDTPVVRFWYNAVKRITCSDLLPVWPNLCAQSPMPHLRPAVIEKGYGVLQAAHKLKKIGCPMNRE